MKIPIRIVASRESPSNQSLVMRNDFPKWLSHFFKHQLLGDVSNEKNHGCLGFIGDSTTQLYNIGIIINLI